MSSTLTTEEACGCLGRKRAITEYRRRSKDDAAFPAHLLPQPILNSV